MQQRWEAGFLESRSPIIVRGKPYQWREARTSPDQSTQWAHHGIVAGFGEAEFTFANPSGTSLVHLIDGVMVETPDIGTAECHGMSLDGYGPAASLWVADNGRKAVKAVSGEYENGEQHPGQVVRVDFDGERLQTLTDELLPAPYQEWRPTGVTSEGSGGGRIWVADGYGREVVHCFDREGNRLWTTNGADSGIPFSCPHGIVLDARGAQPEILVADRGNHRIIALDVDGKFIRSFGDHELTSPSGFSITEDLVLITELYGALTAYDPDGSLVWRLGRGRAPEGQQWPNNRVGALTTRPVLATGRFRSPHGVAVSREGAIGVAEWLIGGRLVLLTPLSLG